MNIIKRLFVFLMVITLCASLSAAALAKSNRNDDNDDKKDRQEDRQHDKDTEELSADVQILKTLGLLVGTGKDGLTNEYSRSKPTRMQGFVIYLRLINEEINLNEYNYHDDDDNFDDHHGHSSYVQKVMAYAKAHPELNWVGSNGKFNPMAHLTAKEYAKIMLTALGYEYDVDFTWNTVESYAEGLGLNVPEGDFTIEALATMTVQTLYMTRAGSSQTLIAYLASVNAEFAAKVKLLGDTTTTDTTKPTVTDLVLSASEQVTIYFSEAMKADTLTNLANYTVDMDGTATVYSGTQLSLQSGAKAVAATDKTSVTLTIPDSALTGGTVAGAGITDITISGLSDTAGNALDSITRFVRKEAVLTAVSYAAVEAAKLQVTFNNPMKTIDPTEFKLYKTDGVTPAATGVRYILDATGKVATITLSSSLTPSAKATESDLTAAKLAIGTANTKDIFGNAVSGAVAVPVVSAATPAIVTIQDRITPAAASLVKGTAAYTFVLTFTEPVDAVDQATLTAALKISSTSGTAMSATYTFSGSGGTVRDFTTVTGVITGAAENKYNIELLGQGICDLAGNIVKAMAKTTLTVQVSNIPVIASAETQDIDKDGYLDAIKLTFNKSIKDSTVDAASFDVAGYNGETFAASTAGDTADNKVIYITFAELGAADTGVTPAIVYTQGTLADTSGNKLASTGVVVTTDKAAPVVMTALPVGTLTAGGINQSAVLVLSEDITAANQITVSAAVQLKATINDLVTVGDIGKVFLWTSARSFTAAITASDNGGVNPDSIVLNAATADLIDLAGNTTTAAKIVK